MRNLEILPEDVLIISEFRLSEIKLIQQAMDNCTVALNLSDPEHKKVHDFFTGDFMNWINSTINTIEK
jgi:hypothetical protein